MKTIVINNQKGGVGKTMLATHLIWDLAEQGFRVLAVDLDGQGNTTKVLAGERQVGFAADLFQEGAKMPTTAEPGISVMGKDDRLESVKSAGIGPMVRNIAQHFSALDDVFDYCVFDTPPAWDERNFAAMTVCDHLLAPIEVKAFALDGIGTLLQSIRAVEERGRKGRPINFLGLIASRFNSHDEGEKSDLRTVVEKVGIKMMFPGVITQRRGYEQAMRDRVPVWTIKTSGAKVAGAEIRAILSTVRDRIGATNSKKDA